MSQPTKKDKNALNMSNKIYSALIVRNIATGEFIVRAYDAQGHWMTECDYFIGDKEDARETRARMLGITRDSELKQTLDDEKGKGK